jgi:hypothetical protein
MFCFGRLEWWARRDSNPGPPACELYRRCERNRSPIIGVFGVGFHRVDRQFGGLGIFSRLGFQRRMGIGHRFGHLRCLGEHHGFGDVSGVGQLRRVGIVDRGRRPLWRPGYELEVTPISRSAQS